MSESTTAVPAELAPTAVARLLLATLVSLRAETAALPPDLARAHPAPGEWCVNEVLGHILEAEDRGFAGRVRMVLADNGCRFETWDQAQVADARKDCERSAADLMLQLGELRQASAQMVSQLTPADLERYGQHVELGRLTVRELLHEWVHHDRVHHEQLLAAVRAGVWPHLGATQGFYDV